MQLISWNIDSINAAVEHKSARGEMTWSVLNQIAEKKPEIFAIQETKLKATGLTKKQSETITTLFPDYQIYTHSSTGRSGYSGTMILSKKIPLKIDYPKIDVPEEMNLEGRIITLEFEDYFVSTVYTPNSGSSLARLEERGQWDDAYRNYIKSLDSQKPVIFSGDMNVAHKEIDLKNPKTNHQSAGFTDQEREKFSQLLSAGFTDTMRAQYPDMTGLYTWWAQISKTSKINNSGWRIDYYLVSNRIASQVTNTEVIDTGLRQDHAPISLEINL
ncbi:exodeoxyribonuclease III [Leuconostoc palmae]|uniref:exodeoxyribonuclease III n=1 Tax=Leuconostoc palmae TaxID=501487 RepID=UPI001C7D54E4|nr:exodeoxyribonuclease III [Leuconostoc palmae]